MALATAGSAQAPSPGRHLLVGVGSDGWRWYAVKDSKKLIQSAPYTTYRFWLMGENPGLQSPRYGKVEVNFACTGVGWYVAKHVTLYDSSRRIVRDILTGDASANWERITPGNPMDGAGRWACSGAAPA
jgi:hypothetical protein